MTPTLADLNIAQYYNEPFWLRFIAHAAFFGGSLYLAARLQADGLARRPAWRYWQIAALCLCLWNLTSVATVILRESVDVGTLVDAKGEPLRGELQTVQGDREYRFYSLTSKHDPMYEGARFTPIGAKGELYYYLQFDVVILLLAGVFALLGLAEERRGGAPAATGEGGHA